MPIKWDVSLNEAIEVVSIVQEAAANDKSELHILDVGGGVRPLVFATHVMDIIEFNRRASMGVIPIEATASACHVTQEHWSVCDINITPWPIPDKKFDIIWCTDTLGMLRDPIAVIREMSRIGKSGYIKVNHRNYESLIGVDGEQYTGIGVNRWLIEPYGDSLLFTYKHPFIHFMEEPEMIGIRDIGLWWTDRINAFENIITDNEEYRRNVLNHVEDSKHWGKIDAKG